MNYKIKDDSERRAIDLADSLFDRDKEPDGWRAFYERALTAFEPDYKRGEQSLEDVEEGIRWERDCRLRITPIS